MPLLNSFCRTESYLSLREVVSKATMESDIGGFLRLTDNITQKIAEANPASSPNSLELEKVKYIYKSTYFHLMIIPLPSMLKAQELLRRIDNRELYHCLRHAKVQRGKEKV